MCGCIHLQEIGAGTQGSREMLSEPPVVRAVRQEMDDESTGALQRFRQIGVGPDQAQQAPRRALGEHQRRNGQPRPLVVASRPDRHRGGQPGPDLADRIVLAGRLRPRVAVAERRTGRPRLIRGGHRTTVPLRNWATAPGQAIGVWRGPGTRAGVSPARLTAAANWRASRGAQPCVSLLKYT